MSYYTEPNSHIKDKVKVVLELSNQATKTELNGDVSNLHLIQLLNFFIALRAEVGKLDIKKLVNVPTSLNSVKTTVINLDTGKLKTVPLDLKKLNDVVNCQVAK